MKRAGLGDATQSGAGENSKPQLGTLRSRPSSTYHLADQKGSGLSASGKT